MKLDGMIAAKRLLLGGAIVLTIFACAACDRAPVQRGKAQQERPTARSTTDPDASTWPPPSGAVQVGPELYVTAIVTEATTSNVGTARRQPFETLSASDEGSFGVSLRMFPSPSFTGGDIRYREVLTLPVPPMTWVDAGIGLPPYDQRKTISKNRRSCTTEWTLPVNVGQVVPSVPIGQGRDFVLEPVVPWDLYPEDPKGEWVIEAFVNDKLVVAKKFIVN